MTKILFILLLVPSCLWASTKSSADAMSDFTSVIQEHTQNCQGTCQQPHSEKVLLNNSVPATNEDIVEISQSLNKIAFDQAQVWGDTILEGDYVARGDIRLDNILALYKEEKLIGYRIVYSQQAWDVSDCSYDNQNDNTLNDCNEGRIAEGSFVSPEFKLYFADEAQYAEFQEK